MLSDVKNYLKEEKVGKSMFSGMGFRGSEVQILSSRPGLPGKQAGYG
jgi:hypothetical protein